MKFLYSSIGLFNVFACIVNLATYYYPLHTLLGIGNGLAAIIMWILRTKTP